MDAFMFDFYDPHADLLELAIWAMYTWFVDHSPFLDDPNSEFGRLWAASQPAAAAPPAPASNVSTDSSATLARTHRKPASNVSTDSSATLARTNRKHASNVSTDSNAALARTHRKPASNVSADSNAALAPTNAQPPDDPAPVAPAVGLLATISAAPLPPAVRRYINALQYFFSASQIYDLMHAEALRRARADLAERLTPASVGRLLSELELPRDRTSQGRRFRLTPYALGKLLVTYPYVFRPDVARTTLTRHIGL